ncbi:MAG: PRC-barrel domain-containing protein [Ilumatobacteraceae bacterium]
MAADIWTFPPTADSMWFLIGYQVLAVDGRVGKIDANSLQADSSYIVIDTGWWIFERKRLIPAGFITSISGTEGKIYLAMTKRDVRAAPAYKPIEHSSESGRYNDFYGST